MSFSVSQKNVNVPAQRGRRPAYAPRNSFTPVQQRFHQNNAKTGNFDTSRRQNFEVECVDDSDKVHKFVFSHSDVDSAAQSLADAVTAQHYGSATSTSYTPGKNSTSTPPDKADHDNPFEQNSFVINGDYAVAIVGFNATQLHMTMHLISEPDPFAILIVDFLGALSHSVYHQGCAKKNLFGAHAIAYKLGRRVRSALSPNLVAAHIVKTMGGNQIAEDALRVDVHCAIKNYIRDEKLESEFAHIFSTDAMTVESTEAALQDHLAKSGIASELAQVTMNVARWDTSHDSILPQLALYDQLLPRKLHTVRGLAVATLAAAASAPNTTIEFSDTGGVPIARGKEVLPKTRVGMWWDMRFSVTYDRQCRYHSLHVNFHPANSAWDVCARRIATFLRKPIEGGERGREATALDDPKCKESGERLAKFIVDNYLDGSSETSMDLEQRALLELLVVPLYVSADTRRTFGVQWVNRWQLAWLQTHAPLDLVKNTGTNLVHENARLALRYKMFSAVLQRHITPPLYYIHDVFSLLFLDVLLRANKSRAYPL